MCVYIVFLVCFGGFFPTHFFVQTVNKLYLQQSINLNNVIVNVPQQGNMQSRSQKSDLPIYQITQRAT